MIRNELPARSAGSSKFFKLDSANFFYASVLYFYKKSGNFIKHTRVLDQLRRFFDGGTMFIIGSRITSALRVPNDCRLFCAMLFG